MTNLKFTDLGLKETLVKAIDDLGFITPSPIQAEAIPVALEGIDIIGQAQTGTGKTAAFGLPLINNLTVKNAIGSIILAPTRELAIQVHDELVKLTKYEKLNIVAVYGGAPIHIQARDLKKANIVVGTPGRVLDHIRRGNLPLSCVEFLVLDEADEMLNMGFVEDIETIISKTNPEHTTMLFSATMPEGIKKIAKNYMKPDYKHIQVKQKTVTANTVKQYYFEVKQKDRFETLCRIIDSETVQSGIIFCRTKRSVDEVTEQMQKANYNVEAMHGDLNQDHRMRTLKKFKEGTIHYLIATDVAARGIDVENISHVINYELPQEVDLYVHRIGRTGRANREGKAYTIVVGKEERYLKEIERKTKSHIEKLEVPTLTQIHQHKVTELMYKLEDMILHGEHKPMKDLVNQIENHMLKDVTAALIELSLNQEIGYPYTKEKLESSSKRKKGASEGYTRLFLTVGSMDKVKKKDIIHFLVSKANIRESDIQGIDIKRKFTFVNINDKAIKKVMQHCQKEKLNGRKVEIEQANSR